MSFEVDTGGFTTSQPQTLTPTSSPTFVGLTLSGMTADSVLFAGAGGVVSQDNSNFFWDNSTKKLSVGGNIILPNNVGFQSKDSGGTVHNLIYVGSDNFLNIPNAGLAGIRLLNQAENSVRLYMSDAGNFAIGGGTPTASTMLSVSGRGLFSGGAVDPSDSSAAGVAISFESSQGRISALQTGIAGYPLILQSAGAGKVGIGSTVNPIALLSVGGTAATAQTFNTFTDASNYENAYMGDWGVTANVATYGTGKAGTGAARAVNISAGGVTGLSLDTSANVVVASGKSLQLGNAYVAGVVVTTGSITLKDSTGTVYRVPCLV